ncbi:MAG: chemotaxis protein MotB [Candidatus Sumerlaeota bacterium]|nr:chemotaxis protein MotB [Candidatus Sumerlaeota bacterium]
MLNRKLTLLAGVVLLAGLTGCSTVQKGTAAGGALGALAGGIVGHNIGSVGTGIAVGTGAGAATGGLAGEAFAETTDADVQREIENLRADLESAERELAELRQNSVGAEVAQQLQDAQNQLATLRAELDRANADLASARSGLETAKAEAARAQAQLTQRHAEMSQRDSELQAARTALGEMEGQMGSLKKDLETTKAERDELAQRLSALETDLASAKKQLNIVQTTLAEKEMANDNLKNQLSELNVQLEETSRGLQLTIVDQLLFNPGSADLTASGQELIGKVAEIIQTNFPGRELAIEGHTDNQPIKHSGWKSNWELGSARATSVLHALISNYGFDPMRLSAATYGEFRPATTNATPEGRAANRRSVIVILPEKMPIQRNQYAGI